MEDLRVLCDFLVWGSQNQTMKLADLTWQDAGALSRDMVVLIPTGSFEQHGPALPLFTDSLLVTAVAEAVEKTVPESVLLTPTLWMGCSGHHMAFPGTINASFEAFEGALASAVGSLIHHGFTRFFVLNGHGGNNEPIGICLRRLKALHTSLTFGHAGYFSYIDKAVLDATLKGPLKGILHSCEAEASMVVHLAPHLVKPAKFIDDGLSVEPPIRGLIHHFDEATEQGVMGYATYANAETGKVLFDSAVEAVAGEMKALAAGYVLTRRTD